MLEAVFLFHDPHMNTETEKVVFGKNPFLENQLLTIKAITVKITMFGKEVNTFSPLPCWIF